MSRLDDADGAWRVEGGEDDGAPPSGEAYDPLLTPWTEAEPRADIDAPGLEDRLFPWEPAPPEVAYRGEAHPGRYSSPAPSAPRYPHYPQPYVPGSERLTDLQRRLREETITVPRPARRWGVTARELAETVLLAVLIFLAVRGSLQNFRVEGLSMEPSLDNGEYLIVNKLAYTQVDLGFMNWLPLFEWNGGNRYLWSAPERGDVVVFRSPTSTNRDFIKRVIGLPGDTVEVDDTTGQVKVNGKVLHEPYVVGTTSCGSLCKREIPTANTPEAIEDCGSTACYFVMGDNRQNSSDSRQGWLVPRENIVGKALITYWHNGSPEVSWAPNHSIGLASDD